MPRRQQEPKPVQAAGRALAGRLEPLLLAGPMSMRQITTTLEADPEVAVGHHAAVAEDRDHGLRPRRERRGLRSQRVLRALRRLDHRREAVPADEVHERQTRDAATQPAEQLAPRVDQLLDMPAAVSVLAVTMAHGR